MNKHAKGRSAHGFHNGTMIKAEDREHTPFGKTITVALHRRSGNDEALGFNSLLSMTHWRARRVSKRAGSPSRLGSSFFFS